MKMTVNIDTVERERERERELYFSKISILLVNYYINIKNKAIEKDNNINL